MWLDLKYNLEEETTGHVKGGLSVADAGKSRINVEAPIFDTTAV